MNQYIQTIKDYLKTRNKDFFLGLSIILGGALLIAGIAAFAYSRTPKVIYQPTKACDLLTLRSAKELLGEKAIQSGSTDPVLDRSGNTATSECGYADGSGDTENMMIVAISVRSGVNDDGVKQNKSEFKTNKSSKTVEAVKDLGESAYYNPSLGQLNVLEDRKWIILNYGVGSAPEANTLEQAIELAHKVLPPTATTSDL